MLMLKQLMVGATIAVLGAGPVSAACRTIQRGQNYAGSLSGRTSWREQGGAFTPAYGSSNTYSPTNIAREVQLNVVTEVTGNSATIYGGYQTVTVNQTSQPIFVGGGESYGTGYGYGEGASYAPGSSSSSASSSSASGGGSGSSDRTHGGGLIGLGSGYTILPVNTGTTGSGNSVLPVNTGVSAANGNTGTNGNGVLNGNSVPVSVGGVVVGTGATMAPNSPIGVPVVNLPGATGPSAAGASSGIGLQTNDQGGSAVQLCSGCAGQLTGGVGG